MRTIVFRKLDRFCIYLTKDGTWTRQKHNAELWPGAMTRTQAQTDALLSIGFAYPDVQTENVP